MKKKTKLSAIMVTAALLSAFSVTAFAQSDANSQSKSTTPQPKHQVHGTITSINGKEVTINDGGKLIKVGLTSNTTYNRGHKETASADILKQGARIRVAGSYNNGEFVAKRVHIEVPHIDGIVAEITGNTISLVKGDTTYIIVVSSSTKYLGKYSEGLSTVKVGDRIHAEGTLDSTMLQANAIHSAPQRGKGKHGHHLADRKPGVGGTIQSVDGDTLVIQTSDGQSIKVKLTNTTEYHSGHQSVEKSSLAVGKKVHIRLANSEQQSGTTEFIAADVRFVIAHP